MVLSEKMRFIRSTWEGNLFFLVEEEDVFLSLEVLQVFGKALEFPLIEILVISDFPEQGFCQ